MAEPLRKPVGLCEVAAAIKEKSLPSDSRPNDKVEDAWGVEDAWAVEDPKGGRFNFDSEQSCKAKEGSATKLAPLGSGATLGIFDLMSRDRRRWNIPRGTLCVSRGTRMRALTATHAKAETYETAPALHGLHRC
jgi:hypothetical protein